MTQDMTLEEVKANYVQTIHLHELKNIAYRIAEAKLRYEDAYFCLYDGKPTKVIK